MKEITSDQKLEVAFAYDSYLHRRIMIHSNVAKLDLLNSTIDINSYIINHCFANVARQDYHLTAN